MKNRRLLLMYITAKVPMRDTGTATLGMSVARGLRKKMKTTRTTSTTEPMRVRSTVATEARMVVVRSRTIVVVMPWGNTASRKGSWALILSTVWMMLAPGWRKMMQVTALLPSV